MSDIGRYYFCTIYAVFIISVYISFFFTGADDRIIILSSTREKLNGPKIEVTSFIGIALTAS